MDGGEEKWMLKLVVGHSHRLLGDEARAAGSGHTHKWTVFLKAAPGAPGLDPALVAKVVFQLHPDFADPKRTVKAPPYEVVETGYGGFSIPIHITFANCKREYYLEYDMNLTYAQADQKQVERMLEFRNPRPSLKQQLIRYGAVPQAVLMKAKAKKEERTGFEALFGQTLSVPKPARKDKDPPPPLDPPKPKPEHKRKPSEEPMNPALLADLVKAVGGDEKDALDLQRRTHSPLFRTGSDEDEDPEPRPKKKRRVKDELGPERLRLLRSLQRRIMSLSERSLAQKVADIVTATPGYSIAPPWLEFDLCALSPDVVDALTAALDEA